ncbi:DnaA regulatory inactivator Hda [Ningiella sp. W23]|uniref:DnaA regulatory inactivator Hda n=1 Tax=Ningiella sp. W23 TaxID=3023715 RepID=UPI003757AD8F
MKHKQLLLAVNDKQDYKFDNYLLAKNGAVVDHLTRITKTVSSPESFSFGLSFVHGGSGVGKTHLLLASLEALQVHSEGLYLDFQQVLNMPPEVMDGVVGTRLLCLDNIDCIASSHAWQEKVFDIINQCTENGESHIIVSSSKPVNLCDFSLQDLSSRLIWGTTYAIKELNEAQKQAALRMHFEQRGIHIQDDTLSFLMKRCQRDMHKLMSILDELDKLSLAEQRKITIPFVKQALSI